MDQQLQTRLARLAARSRASANVAADDREARDDAIEEADREGVGVREIARATRLAPSTVEKIIVGRAAARQAAS